MSTVMLPAVRETETEVAEKSVKEGLQRALDLLREDGWCKYALAQPNGRGRESHCVLGALWDVFDDDPGYYMQMALSLTSVLGVKVGDDIPWQWHRKDGELVTCKLPDVSPIATWNDQAERTFEEVETVFEYAIEKAES